MKIAFVSQLIFAALLAGCVSQPVKERQRSTLQAGAAEIDITPPVGHRMAGYFSERLSTGTHDPLKAKAIVIKQGGQTFAMVFCDLVGISLNVSTNARAQAARAAGIPVSNIFISATHSHTGPLFDDADDVWRDFFHAPAVAKHGRDPHEAIYYPAFLIEQILKVISLGKSDLRDAVLSAGVLKQENLTFNRRFWMKNGRVAFNPGQLNTNIVRAAGPSDPDAGVLMARDSRTMKPFAAATVFAMHADTVGGSEYSADFPFYLEQTLRGAYGTNFISAFAAGTSGDLNHIDVRKKEPIKGFSVGERLGTTLGKTVIEGVRNLPPVNEPALAVRTATIQAPLQEPSPAQIADARAKGEKLGDPKEDFMGRVVGMKILDLASRGKTWPMEVQVFRLDAQTAMVCLPCEIFAELGTVVCGPWTAPPSSISHLQSSNRFLGPWSAPSHLPSTI